MALGAVRATRVAGVIHCVYSLINESDGVVAECEFKSPVDGEPEG